MTQAFLTVSTLLSALYFPWPFTALLALLSAPSEPLTPLAAGLLIDTLYYTPASQSYPLATLLGALATGLAWFVRTRLRTGIID